MQRIFSLLIGVVVLGYGGYQLYSYFYPSLPTCDSSDTQDLLNQLVMKALPSSMTDDGKAETLDALKKGVAFKSLKEVSYDKDKDIRECTGSVDVSKGSEKVIDNQAFAYRVTWQDKGDRKFYVELHPVTP